MVSTKESRELHEVQERLAAAGLLDRGVVLPGAETTVAGAVSPRQGALHVEQVESGWEVFSSEYGLREVL